MNKKLAIGVGGGLIFGGALIFMESVCGHSVTMALTIPVFIIICIPALILNGGD